MNKKLGVNFSIRDSADGPVEILVYETIGKDPWTGEGLDAQAFIKKLDGLKNDRDLLIRFNSRGGDVFEGLAIYNRIAEWKGKTTGRVDGVAASIASVMLMGCDSVEMPQASQLFIHDAWGVCVGNAAEMEDMANRLNVSSNQLAEIYAAKTKKPVDEMRQLMRATTLMTGKEAVERGFADKLIDGDPLYNFSPEDITSIKALALPSNGDQKKNTPDGNQPLTDGRAVISPAKEDGKSEPTNPPHERKNMENATTAAAPNTAEITQLRAELDTIKAAHDKERRDRIERTIDQCVVEDRIPGAQRDAWIARALKDETVLNDLKAMQPKPPGADPVGIQTGQSDFRDIVKKAMAFEDPMKAWQRGNGVSMKQLAAASMERGRFLNAHMEQLRPIFDTNTIDSTLKRTAILQTVIRDFAKRLMVFNAFSTVFSNVPLEGTNTVQVPYYDLDSTASTAWDPSTGYAAGNTITDNRQIYVGYVNGQTTCGRLYQGLSFTSAEISEQPYLKIEQLAQLKAEKLAYDLFTAVMGVVLAATYTTAAVTKDAVDYTSDDITDIKSACKLWPEAGRSLIVGSEIDAALLKDPYIKAAMNFGGPEAIRQGKIPSLFGFDYYECPNIPTNSEKLIGMAVFKSAILVATVPVPPAQEVRNAGTTYQVITDPQTGIAFEYRAFGDNTLDTAKHFVEVSYGYASGNATALKRLVSVS